MKENLKGIPKSDLEKKMIALGHNAYRGRQLFQWIYQKRETNFEQMTNLSKVFRKDLEEKFFLAQLKVDQQQVSSDGTIKFLVLLEDGEKVESVFIPQEGRNTLCISTQVGCKMGCVFCATGYQKFTRDLKSWEIVDQLLSVPVPEPATNIVFMGMGEPFDNYEEVMKALDILQDPYGPQIGKRHITVSTVGISPKIFSFVESNLGKLAISLHGTTDEQRRKVMPICRKYPLKDLIRTCESIRPKGTQRLTFAYLLIKDFNDSDEDARRLSKLLSGLPCKINLLAYNENPFTSFKRPEEARILRFQSLLMQKHYTVTYRRSRGRDIAGACGQLSTESKIPTQPGRLLKRVRVKRPEEKRDAF